MAQFERGNKEGRKFTSDNQPARRGRGRLSVLNYIRKTTGKRVDPQSSREEIYKVIQHIYESSPAELEPLMKDPENPSKPNPDTPIWVLNIIAAINNDIRYGRTSTIEMLFDRVFGKATQPIEGELNTKVTATNNFRVLTPEEIRNFDKYFEENF